MIYILAWIVCAVCTYYILKDWVYKLTENKEGLLVCVKELFEDFEREQIEEKGYTDESWKIIPDNFLTAFLHTFMLVMCLVIWPLVLGFVAWCKFTNKTWDELAYETDVNVEDE